MRNFLIVLFLVFMAQAASAQFDTPIKGTAIPKAKKKPKKKLPPKPEAPRVFSITPPKENSQAYQIGTKKEDFSMMQQEKFVSRSAEYQDRVTIKPRGESNEAYKGNMDFGVIRTKSPYLVLMAADFGAEDGDRVKITLNDAVIMSSVLLSHTGQAVMITLNEGFNDLRVEALNQGYSGPNTGNFRIYDNKKEELAGGDWYLATGFHAKYLVIKE